MKFAGVDVSERRGQSVALLDHETLSLEVDTLHNLNALVDRLGEAACVGIDAPLALSRMLLRDGDQRARWGVPPRSGPAGLIYANYRVCDYELIRRGLPLYQVPDRLERAPEWMRVGFAIAEGLQARGLRTPAHTSDYDARLIEVFPDGAFVTLAGGRPARKSTPQGRRQRRDLLRAAGILVAERAGHDLLDAAVAALTAMRWHEGRACALGDAGEGLIVLPVAAENLKDRYLALRVNNLSTNWPECE